MKIKIAYHSYREPMSFESLQFEFLDFFGNPSRRNIARAVVEWAAENSARPVWWQIL